MQTTGIPISLLFTIIGALITAFAGIVWYIFWKKFGKVEADIVDLQANKSSRQHIDSEIGHIKELMNLRFQCLDTQVKSIHEKIDMMFKSIKKIR